MKNFINVILILSILLSSCEDSFVDRCFSGDAGEMVLVEIPEDSAITRIFFQGEAEVFLRDGETQKIEVEFPENLLDDLEFQYEKGNYRFYNHVTCKYRKETYAPRLYLTLPHIKRFDVLEFVNVYSEDTLRYDNVKFYSLGTGDIDIKVNINKLNVQSDYVSDITISGKVNQLSMWYEELGRFYGQNLEASEISIGHNGENSVHLNPINKLNAQLHNIGDLYLYNEPEVMEVSEEGSGKVIFVGEE